MVNTIEFQDFELFIGKYLGPANFLAGFVVLLFQLGHYKITL